MKVKTITIKDEHEEWLHDNSVSLSRLVQKCIDERMCVEIEFLEKETT